MKCILKYAVLICICMFSMVAYTSCEKETTKEESYIGESELDYKPADYTISLDWDFSKVANLTDAKKAELKKEADGSTTKTFDTRKDATLTFDAIVVSLQSEPATIETKGAKCVARLKRGVNLCKKAIITW